MVEEHGLSWLPSRKITSSMLRTMLQLVLWARDCILGIEVNWRFPSFRSQDGLVFGITVLIGLTID